MKNVLLILTFSIVTLSAYDVEKEGNWWYVYNGNDIVGAYSESGSKYTVGCGDPKVSSYQTKYIDSSGYYMFQMYKTKREAQNAITQYCKKR